MRSVKLAEIATRDNFDEAAYLRANPDVRAAVESAQFTSGRAHFDVLGHKEGRRQLFLGDRVLEMRDRKMKRLSPFLRTDMKHQWQGRKVDYLTRELRAATRIADTNHVSSNEYDGYGIAIIERHPNGLILDCGAGSRSSYFENVVNFEIVDYPSTDVLGVGEELPFLNSTFDGIISVAVLEHVRDPFKCANEITRVLKRGGVLYCCVPFLQPYHGYPHHYFNATAQGIRRLFEDDLEIIDQRVLDSMKPLAALQWILASWKQGLSEPTADKFSQMTVSEFLADQAELLTKPFCSELSNDKLLELACATVITARKP
jgi:SAM-dependent methyltransferase